MKNLSKAVSVSLLLLAAACGGGGQPQVDRPFSFSVDTSLTPHPEVRGGKVIVAARSEGGAIHLFVANEVLIAPRSQAELEGFLARMGGTVIGNDAVPDPPPGSGIQVNPSFKVPTSYVVRVNPSRFDLGTFKTDAEKAGLRGTTVFSSEDAARLLAGVVREKANGLSVSPNFVMENTGLLFYTREHHDEDALDYPQFSSSGSRSSVAQMLQLVAAQPPTRRTRVAIIDSGFWLDNEGRSLSADLPERPIQYDFHADDYIANGPNLNSCTGGSYCPWHGTGAAHVAVAMLNNRFGAAGTGGQVADPMLFNTSIDWGKVARSIRTAVAWGADVISMSFGGPCDNFFCDIFLETNLYPALRNARDNGVVSIATAGNNSESANGRVPCKAAEVICVGALADGTNTAIGYSNFGSSVGIWAPTNIPAIHGYSEPLSRTTFGGTSASAPFVAGVIAVLRAYDPGLNLDRARDLLRRTAWTDSSDPKVSHYINAYQALREVHRFTPDALEPNDSVSSATPVAPIGMRPVCSDNLPLGNLNVHSNSNPDYFRFTLSEYSLLYAGLRFIPALGDLGIALVKARDGALGSPEGISFGRGDIGVGYEVLLAPPGTYYLVVNGSSTPNAYNLHLCASNSPLEPDTYEANDTLGTARVLEPGSYQANLHNLADVDHYRFNYTLIPSLGSFVFSVTNRDMHLTLRLYDSSGSQVDVVNCNSAAVACKLTLPSIAHTVRVETFADGPARGRYTFAANIVYDRSLLPRFNLFPDQPFYFLQPSRPPIPGRLVELRDIYVFEKDAKAIKGLLAGEGLRLRLFDSSGQAIRDSTPIADPQLPGAEIALGDLQNGQRYVLVVERTDLPRLEDEVLGILPYSLDLTN